MSILVISIIDGLSQVIVPLPYLLNLFFSFICNSDIAGMIGGVVDHKMSLPFVSSSQVGINGKLDNIRSSARVESSSKIYCGAKDLVEYN